MHFILTEKMKILSFIDIYYHSYISENISHISVINKLSNSDLIKNIKKEGGEQLIAANTGLMSRSRQNTDF